MVVFNAAAPDQSPARCLRRSAVGAGAATDSCRLCQVALSTVC